MSEAHALSSASLDIERELLLYCAGEAGSVADMQPLTDMVDRGVNWERLLALADAHGLGPLTHEALIRLPAHRVPTPVLARLWVQTVANKRRNHRRAVELLRLLKVLEAGGIRAIPLKGPVLTAWLYGDLGLRVFGDLDILVGRDDVLRARDVLALEGYRAASPLRPEDDAAFVAAERQYDFELVHERTGDLVELHWKTNTEFAIERLDDPQWWFSLATTELEGQPVRMLNRRETLFSLLIHGSKHLWSRLNWLVDIARLVPKLDDEDWAWLIREAQKHRCKRRIALGLLLVKDLLRQPLPRNVESAFCHLASIERIALHVTVAAFKLGDAGTSVPENLKFDVMLYDTLPQRARHLALIALTPNANAWAEASASGGHGVAAMLLRWWRLAKKYLFRQTA